MAKRVVVATHTKLYALLQLSEYRPNYMVAARLGMPAIRLSEYARGLREIPDRLLIRLVEFFDCPPEELLGPWEPIVLSDRD